MNEHLVPVLDSVLPALPRAGIQYWAYGGVAVAAVRGTYHRSNRDVDICVRHQDYDAAIEATTGVTARFGWTTHDAKLRGRRKREFFDTDGLELLSIVSLEVLERSARFQFPYGSDLVIPRSELRVHRRMIDDLPLDTFGVSVLSALLRHYRSVLRSAAGSTRVQMIQLLHAINADASVLA